MPQREAWVTWSCIMCDISGVPDEIEYCTRRGWLVGEAKTWIGVIMSSASQSLLELCKIEKESVVTNDNSQLIKYFIAM